MKHNHKIGKCIKDKELKVIKLFLGDLNLMDSVKIPRYCDYLTNSLVKLFSLLNRRFVSSIAFFTI
jgi:hypothetical protein